MTSAPIVLHPSLAGVLTENLCPKYHMSADFTVYGGKFGHHGAGAAWTGESGNGHYQMQKRGGEIAHHRSLPRSRHGQRTLTNLEFAMDRFRQSGKRCP